MKKITVSVDDETYHRARIAASERYTSVSAMVREYLTALVGKEMDFEGLKRAESEFRARIGSFHAADRLSRDELHEHKS
jgi:Arc/MetJ-type ribon-helix-helix transcriptional regulator